MNFLMTLEAMVSQTHNSEKICEFDLLYDKKTMNFRRPSTNKKTADSNILNDARIDAVVGYFHSSQG